MKENTSTALQHLTNKFLSDLFDLYHLEQIKEKSKSTHPQLVNDKRDDSFVFNYKLPHYLLNSNHFQQHQKNIDYPLIGSGFVANVCKESFKQHIQGISIDLKFIITHFNQQDTGLDYFAKNYQQTSIHKIVKVINTEFFHDTTQPFEIGKEVKFTTESMLIHNNKNSYIGKCIIESEDNELERILLYGVRDGDGGNNQDLQLQINYHQIDGIETPEILHFKHIANINSFFLMVEQIIYGIKETIN